jgi:hypothetical protein
MKFYLCAIAMCTLLGAADYLYPSFFHDPVRIVAMVAWSLALTLPLTVILGWFNPLLWTVRHKLWSVFNGFWYVFGLAHFFVPQLQTPDAGGVGMGVFFLLAAIGLTVFSIRARNWLR